MKIPDNMSKQQKYDLVIKDYYAIANWYDGKYDASKEFKLQLQSFISSLPSNAKVLDVASGTGKESSVIAKHASVTALDISQEMLKKLSSRIHNITTIIGTMVDLPFEDKSFDAIWSSRGIIHIPREDIQKVIQEFKRVLKIGGLLGLIFLENTDEVEYIEEFLPETEASNNEGLIYYRNLYSEKFIIDILKKEGCIIEKSEVCMDMDQEQNRYIQARVS